MLSIQNIEEMFKDCPIDLKDIGKEEENGISIGGSPVLHHRQYNEVMFIKPPFMNELKEYLEKQGLKVKLCKYTYVNNGWYAQTIIDTLSVWYYSDGIINKDWSSLHQYESPFFYITGDLKPNNKLGWIEKLRSYSIVRSIHCSQPESKLKSDLQEKSQIGDSFYKGLDFKTFLKLWNIHLNYLENIPKNPSALITTAVEKYCKICSRGLKLKKPDFKNMNKNEISELEIKYNNLIKMIEEFD